MESYHAKRMSELKKKFSMDSLQLEGRATPKEKTVEQILEQQAKEQDNFYREYRSFGSHRNKGMLFGLQVSIRH
jgi:hypothetical protein